MTILLTNTPKVKSVEDVQRVFRSFNPLDGLALPSQPAQPIVVHEEAGTLRPSYSRAKHPFLCDTFRFIETYRNCHTKQNNFLQNKFSFLTQKRVFRTGISTTTVVVVVYQLYMVVRWCISITTVVVVY